MSTLLSEERAVDTAAKPLSFLARLARWYRDAVTEPPTEREQAEWQRNSF